MTGSSTASVAAPLPYQPVPEAEPETYFTPDRVARLYFHYAWLEGMAEGKTTATYSDMPRGLRAHHDRRDWAAVKAALDAAHEALGRHSLDWELIELRKRGLWIRTIASDKRRDVRWLLRVHNLAILRVCAMLNGGELPRELT